MSPPDHCKTLILEEGHNELKVSLKLLLLSTIYKILLDIHTVKGSRESTVRLAMILG